MLSMPMIISVWMVDISAGVLLVADGIDAGDSVVVNGGAINLLINTIDPKAIKSDGNITINKCDSINIVLNGAADRGIKVRYLSA